MPIVKLFYAENGLENFELFTLHAIYSVTIALLEIPSGYMADIWGRKKSLILGAIFGTVGFSIYSVSGGFTGFLIAELALGTGQSFISGSDSAMLYDTLKDVKKENQYLKFEGRISAIGNFAESIAGILGAFLAISSARLPYQVQTGIAFLGIIAAMLLKDPSSHKNLRPEKITYIFKIVHFALFENKPLRNTILLSSVIGFSTLTMAWFAQIYFFEIETPRALYGILWTALNLTVGIGSLYAHKIEFWLGSKKTIYLITGFISLGYFLQGTFIVPWAIALFFVFYFARGIATPVLKDYINRNTASEIRATVLSLRSLIIRIIYAVFGPLLGLLSDKKGLRPALYLAGIFILITGFLSAWKVIQTQMKKNSF
ncbi:MAG: MFS transporter [Bacteroidales bacterium]|nr:MFS transporter [Bacteroidales bacterium]